MTFDNEGLVKTLKFLASFERAENQSDPYFYLMIWAILMLNLQDIAKFFWQHCKVHVFTVYLYCWDFYIDIVCI